MKSETGEKRDGRLRSNDIWLATVRLGPVALAAILCASAPRPASALRAGGSEPSERSAALSFTDARRQAAEFISYHRSIVLTPEQQEIMKTGLSRIPAPCCAAYSIATCCCPCNLAKSTWGLSKFLIARRGTSASEVQAAASEWLRFINPRGYTGDACFRGGCERPFSQNGCGGMNERHIR